MFWTKNQSVGDLNEQTSTGKRVYECRHAVQVCLSLPPNSHFIHNMTCSTQVIFLKLTLSQKKIVHPLNLVRVGWTVMVVGQTVKMTIAAVVLLTVRWEMLTEVMWALE